MIHTYSKQPKNPFPDFVPPEHHKSRPIVLRRWQEWSSEKPLQNWIGWLYLRKSGNRKNAIHPAREKSLQAVVQAMLHHLNLVTHQVEASIEQMADECGLSTMSKAGNKSICRVSRLFTDLLEPSGCVETVKVWDKNAECWIPKYVEVLPRFFEMIGVGLQYVEKEQGRRIVYAQKRLVSNRDAGMLTISELKELAKKEHIRKAFKIRKSKIQNSKNKRFAKRIDASKQAKGYGVLDNDIALSILESLSLEQTKNLSSVELRRLVNVQKSYYEAMLDEPYKSPPN